MKVCAIFLFVLVAALCHEHTFKCVFDELNKDISSESADNVPEVPIYPLGKHINGRLLQAPSTSHFTDFRIELVTS